MAASAAAPAWKRWPTAWSPPAPPPHPSPTFPPPRLVPRPGPQWPPAPLPGWALPGAMTPGALQTLARGQRVSPDRRVLIAGNGPLNLQLACELLHGGVEIAAVVEAAPYPG